MPLTMMPCAGLPAFFSDFSLQQNQGAALFARSARTIRRWCRRGRAPQHALDLLQIIREQRPPLTASFRREQRASDPAWSARLARPRPVMRRRARLVSIAKGYAANRMPERAAECLREAWPEATGAECWHAATSMCALAEGARLAAVERQHLERAGRRAYLRRRRRR